MRVTIFAVGRMKSGPEAELASRYADRFAKAGRQLGLEFDGITETVESRGQTAELRKAEEGRRCAEASGEPGSVLILLDERGKSLSSRQFAQVMARHRDDGAGRLILSIGGADGHDADLRQKADLVVSFGAQTWPHQLARIMLLEQLYRAATILSGHPYHRD